MPEMHLRQPGFTSSAFGPFPKTKELLKLKETGDWRYIYQNKLHKAWFQHYVGLEILRICLEEQFLIIN